MRGCEEGCFLHSFSGWRLVVRERRDILLESSHGTQIVLAHGFLVAWSTLSWLGGRALFWVKEGERVSAGARLGLTRFGGMREIYLPKDLKTMVHPGQTVVWGDGVGFSTSCCR